jgi:hypothetical protein
MLTGHHWTEDQLTGGQSTGNRKTGNQKKPENRKTEVLRIGDQRTPGRKRKRKQTGRWRRD